MKTREELLELIKDSMRLDWLEMNMECHTEKNAHSDQWVWKEATLTNRDLRKAIDAEMLTEKPT